MSGWIGKTEVVKLEFDPRVVTYEKLVEQAKSHDCATSAFPTSEKQAPIARRVYGDQVLPIDAKFRPVKDTKYYLRNTPMKFVPMTLAQATRANATVKEARTSGVLSDAQLKLLSFIEKHPKAGWTDVVDRDFVESWAKVVAKRDDIERAAKPKVGSVDVRGD